MAEALVNYSFKKQFDDQLTCGVCLDQYNNPKMLPCGHTFCLHCTQQLPAQKKEGKYYISCPKCRVDHLTPEGGAINLPTNFEINNFLELHKKLATPETNNKTTTTCPKHNDPLKVYCETCCQVICCECTISKEHNTHNFHLISECYPKHHQQLQDSLEQIKRKTANIDTAITDLATRKEEVLQQGQGVKEQINTHAQQIIDQVQRSRTCLLQQVDAIVQQKTRTLTAQKQQALKVHTQLKTFQEKIEHSLKEWNQHQILTKKHILMDEINAATQNADPAVFKPIENANIKFTKAKKKKLEKEEEIGVITGTTYRTTFLIASPCHINQQSKAYLMSLSHDGSQLSLTPSLISSTLSSGDKLTVNNNNFTGSYSITFTPSTRKDHLMVQVGGVDIPESPFPLSVIPSPQVKPANIIPELNVPVGVAVCDNGDIIDIIVKC